MGWDAMALYRLGRSLSRWRLRRASAWVQRASVVLFSAYLPPGTELGEGTRLGYGGLGVMLHPRARVGRGCLISQFVSIGGCGGAQGVGTVGDFVRIGTGARVVGPVHIGDFAVVGANSVVTRDVPPGAVVFGVPARVVRLMEDPVGEYERDTGQTISAADRSRWKPAARNVIVRPERSLTGEVEGSADPWGRPEAHAAPTPARRDYAQGERRESEEDRVL